MIRKFSLYADVVLLVFLSILSLFVKNIGVSVIFLFFAPGYLLVNNLYPDLRQPRYGLRVVMSVGISTVVTGLLGLIHSYFIGNGFSILATIAIFNGVLGITIFFRRQLLEDPGGIELLNLSQIKMGAWDFAKYISLFICISVFAYFLWSVSNQPPEFTEFYMVGSEGLAADYPVEVTVNTPFHITVGVVNYEGEVGRYGILTGVDEETVGALGVVEIQDGETWEDDLFVVLPKVGDNQRVDIFLVREGYDFPFRTLWLWMDVKPKE